MAPVLMSADVTYLSCDAAKSDLRSWMYLIIERFVDCFCLNMLFFQQLHSVHQCLLGTHRSAVHRLQVKEEEKGEKALGMKGWGWVGGEDVGSKWVYTILYCFSLKLGMGFKRGGLEYHISTSWNSWSNVWRVFLQVCLLFFVTNKATRYTCPLCWSDVWIIVSHSHQVKLN